MGKKKDRWPELCELVQEDDGLRVRDAGSWTEQKIHFWSRYLDITTTSMAKKPQWAGGLVYVDLFAGPGVCVVRDTNRRFPGSVVVAANQVHQFSKIIACEKDIECAQACEERLARSPAGGHFAMVVGDCNERIEEVCQHIPQRSLTLAFVDPESLHIHFDTIRVLADGRQADLLILFADRYDIVRNVELYAGQEHSKLDEVLGEDSDWRNKWRALPNQNAANTCKLFADIYKTQLSDKLEYQVFGEKVMSSQRGPLYRLIFASKHQLGLDFWHKATSKDIAGQRELF